ncbi:unnamed protein product [Hymenolepis diminuta]|uniref:MADF domain-containing protein n=1 Tax=Hymenolepis diminuta TaxID=6216 RepID=A0A0R3SX45_HYMDI|nr:unnamed protein product [Hymenolepis diminuta]
MVIIIVVEVFSAINFQKKDESVATMKKRYKKYKWLLKHRGRAGAPSESDSDPHEENGDDDDKGEDDGDIDSTTKIGEREDYGDREAEE